MAERRVPQRAQQQKRARQRNERKAVETGGAIEGDGAPAEQVRCRLDVDIGAVRNRRAPAARNVVKQHLREGQGHHDEIDARQTHDQEADDQCRDRGGKHRQRQRQIQAARAVLRREPIQRVGANPVEGGVAEADQSGKADKQIKAEGKDRHDQDLCHQLQREGAGDGREQRQHQQSDTQQQDLGSVHPVRPHRTGRTALPVATSTPPPSAHRSSCPQTAAGKLGRTCRRDRPATPQERRP